MEISIYYFSQVPMHSLDFGRADYLPIVTIVTMHSLVRPQPAANRQPVLHAEKSGTAGK